MAEADDPRWNADTDRITHRLADSVAAPTTAAASGSLPDTHVRGPPPPPLPPPEASPATPVLTEDALFGARRCAVAGEQKQSRVQAPAATRRRWLRGWWEFIGYPRPWPT